MIIARVTPAYVKPVTVVKPLIKVGRNTNLFFIFEYGNSKYME